MIPKSILQPIYHPVFTQHKITVQVKRDDMIDHVVSGNKWRKLQHNLLHAKNSGARGIITFGGCFSNHIHASAFACKQQGLNAIGIIRGELANQHNYTLAWAKYWGMQLNFVDRKTYRLRNNQTYLSSLQQLYPDYLIVPEGGSNTLALTGMTDVINELNSQAQFDTIMTPVGSGGTLAGLVLGDKNQHQLLGVAVLKQGEYLNEQVKELLPQQAKAYDNWHIFTQYHGGGYAKFSEGDVNDLLAFNEETGVTFEPVYSGKMILALLDLVKQGYFPKHHRIVLLHTGGLQGIAGLISRKMLNEKDWPILKHAPSKP